MNNLTYMRVISKYDEDIPKLMEIYQTPEILSHIHISDNYWYYISNTTNVYFYKIYDDELIGSIHLETYNDILFMDIVIFPKYQKMGFGTTVIKDIQNDIFELHYKKIEISIDETNVASINLYKKAGFEYLSKNDELLNFVYLK